ncbi:uncharacterized protein [Branchiostoma lanceolatum]|uniref:uncharacterized protein n=1 Tax=Branchiostoma lanceolatum TaxID=7740 RepID=UPI0034531A06
MDRTRQATGKQPKRKALNRREKHVQDDDWSEANLRALMMKTSSSKKLNLSDKSLDQIPPDVFSIKDIDILDVSNNPLGSIPVNIANLPNLKEVRAAGCGIREVSGNISRCTYLSKVDLSRNPCITTLPVTMKQLRYLKHFAMSGCELKSLPKNMTFLAMIETLDLSNNELTTLPLDISGLKRLKVLILNDNAFESIPESVESLGHLHCFEMKRNKMNNIHGGQKLNVPAHLQTLDMEGNYSLNLLPEGLEKLENLEELNISYCGIETVPDSFGKLTSIRRIHLAGNKLRTLPANSGNLLNLETLDLEGNRRLSSLPLSLYHPRKTLRDKQTGTNIGLILDNCPALALPESEVAEGNVVSVLVELLSEDIIERATVIVAVEVVQDTIIEGLTENMVAVTEGRVWDDIMTDVTSVAISDKECSEDIFSSILKEVMSGHVNEIIIESVNEERAMIVMTDKLLDETTRSMTEEVATGALQVDAVAWEVLQEVFNEMTKAMTKSIALNDNKEWRLSMGLMEILLDEVIKSTATSVALEVDGELRLGQTVPDEYDRQFSHKISAAADVMQYVDLPAGGRLSVPPGATDEDISVITAVLNPHGYDRTLRLQDHELLVSDIIEMRPAGMEFNKPVKLKIPHSLPKYYCEKEFVVKTTENLGITWRTLDTVSQQEQGQWFVTVEVDHFSEFVVVAKPLEYCQRVERGQPSTLRSSQQTDVEMSFPRDCVPYSRDITFKVLPVDTDTLTCASMGEDGVSGIDSMSHIVQFCRGSSQLLNRPVTIVLPLSPGDRDTRVRVLSCGERGHWEDVTSSVDDIVRQGSKVAFKTDQLKAGFTVIRCDNLEDPTRMVNMVMKNIRARQVRILIFKKWREPREKGVMSARIECVLSGRVEDRIVYAEQVEGFERQVGTPTPPIVMMEGEEICVIFEGSIRPVDNDCGVDYIFYCERPRVLEFDAKLVNKGKGATSRVELYPGRLENLYPSARRRKVRGPTIQKKPPTPPPKKQTPPPPDPPKVEKPKPPPPQKVRPPPSPPQKVEPPPPPPRPKPLMTAEITPPTAIICEYWLACQRFKNTFEIGDHYLSPTRDKCFCPTCHGGRGDQGSCSRGNPQKTYARPVGWSRFGLSVNPAFTDEQLRVFTDWHRAYHGTSPSAVKQILQTSSQLLMPGDVTLGGQELGPGKGKGFDSVQVFVSPSIKYSGQDLYAEPIRFQDKHDGKTYTARVAFQVCVRPGSYQVMQETMGFSSRGQTVDPLFSNAELEWYTKERGVHALYGLLVRLEAD